MSLRVVALMVIMCRYGAYSNEEPITALSGQSVVLESKADQSKTLSRAQWSIYPNTTFIAQLKEGVFVDYYVWRYLGRLKVNETTADLTICNVTVSDSMAYDVSLVYSDGSRETKKVLLQVQERLKTPDVKEMLNYLKDHQCHVTLRCSASGQNVNLSWTPAGDFSGLFISGGQSPLIAYVSFCDDQSVTLSCTASSGQQTETQQVTVRCSDTKQKCEDCSACSSRCSCVSSVIGTIIIIVLSLALICGYINRKTIKESIQNRGVTIVRHEPQTPDPACEEEKTSTQQI